jgi:nucleoside-diphosphate-sugar epimerase
MEIKILVTGVEGYVGGMVYQQLEILSRYYFMNPDSSNNIYVKPLYYLDSKSLKLIDEEFDFIFHCAVIGGRRFDKNEIDVFDSNLELFDLIKEIKSNKIIHFTSAADLDRSYEIEYAIPDKVLDSLPNDNFGLAKNFISKEIIKNKIGLNLRIFNIYGRYIENSNNFIDSIIDSCLLNNEIKLQEDRHFDIFYIENLRTILSKIISSEILSDYNLVHQKKYKISEIILFIRDYLNSNSNVKILDKGLSYTGKNTIQINAIDMKDPLTDLKEYINIRKYKSKNSY